MHRPVQFITFLVRVFEEILTILARMTSRPGGGTLGISGWGCAVRVSRENLKSISIFLIFLSGNSWFPSFDET